MYKMLPSRSRMSYTCTKGLQNAPGQNNCFLNCAVQVFWHLDVFRRSFRILSGHACLGNSCIFCALKVIFTQFQYSDQSVLPADTLRKALAESFADQQRFQLGIMDDAAECFENILYRIHFHIANEENEDKCTAPHCIPHQKFSLNVVEQIVCQCGAMSEPLPFSQMVLYVSATALASQASALMEEEGQHFDPSEKFSTLVGRAHTAGDYRTCPGNCGRKVLIRRNLMNRPDIISLGLIWDSDRPSFDHILDVAETIGTNLRLTDLFNIVKDGDARHTTYELMGVVCYYGKHYSTFMRHTKTGSWVYFDDATVKEMGRNFQDVIDKCCKGRYQPLLLMYANTEAQAIDPSTAPKMTYPVPANVAPRNHSRTNSRDRSLSPDRVLYQPPKEQAQSDLAALQRRAVTPNPHHWEARESVEPPVRRAVTPGPEWGRYESDDDDGSKKNKPAVAHHRQGSFLIAVSGNLESTGEIALNDADGSKKPYTHKQLAANAYNKLKNQNPQPMETIYAKTQMGDHVDGGRYTMSQQGGQYGALGGYRNYGGAHGSAPGYGYIDNQEAQQTLQSKEKEKHKPSPLQRRNSNNGGSPSRHKRTKSAESKTSDKDIYGYTLSTNGQYKRPGQVPDSPKSPTGGWGQNIFKKAAEIQRKESFKKGRGRVGADVIRFQSTSEDGSSIGGEDLESERQPVKSNSADNLLGTPTKKVVRTQSVDDSLSSHASQPTNYARAKSADDSLHGPHQQGTFMRAKSVEGNLHQYQGPASIMLQDPPKRAVGSRTYDDAYMVHSGTYVDNGFASLPRQRRKTAGGAHTYANIDDLPQGKEPEVKTIQRMTSYNTQSSVGSTGSDSGRSSDQDNSSYISRSAVESILKRQQGMRGHLQQGSKIQKPKGPMKAQAPFMIVNPATATKNTLNVPSNVRETLKVDIPDTSSLGSHQDSGYRSNESGTSGDRNSASSASSMSVDSPTVSSSGSQQTKNAFMPSQGLAIYAVARQPVRQSSQDLNRSQDGSGSGSKSSTPRNEGPLDNQKKEILDGNQNTVPQQGLLMQANLTKVPGMSNPINMDNLDPSSYEKLGFKSHFDHLLNMAEDLMLRSTQKENEGDFATALQLCSQATISLKQAMDVPYIDYQSFMHAQLKHNSCVMRCKSLHRNAVIRQESNQSTQSDNSTGDQHSLSSMSTDTTDSREETHVPHSGRRITKSQSTGQLQNISGNPGNYQMVGTLGRPVGQNLQEQQRSRTPGPQVAVKPQVNPGGQHVTSFHDPLPKQVQNLPRESENDSDTSHSSIVSVPKTGSDSGVYSVRERKMKRHPGPVKAVRPHGVSQAASQNQNGPKNSDGSDSVDGSFEDGRGYDIYATLPKKGSRREKIMQQKSKNVEVYLDYLNKQKSTAKASSSQEGQNNSAPEAGSQRLQGGAPHQKMENRASDSGNQPGGRDIRTLLMQDMKNRQQQKQEAAKDTSAPVPQQAAGQTPEKNKPTPEKRKTPPPPPVRRSSLGPNPEELAKIQTTVQNHLQSQNVQAKPQPPVRVNSEGPKPSESGATISQARLGRQVSAPVQQGYSHYHDPAALGLQGHGPNSNVPNSVSERTSSHNAPGQVLPPEGRYIVASGNRTVDNRQQTHYALCGQSLVNQGQQGHGHYVPHHSQPSQRKQLDTRWNTLNSIKSKDVQVMSHCSRCGKDNTWIPETGVCINCDVRGKGPKNLPSNGIMKKSKSQSHLNFPSDHGGTTMTAMRCEEEVTIPNIKQLRPSDSCDLLEMPITSSPDLFDLNPAMISPDEGIQLSSDTSKQSSTDSDFSGCMRSVKELALRFEHVDFGKGITAKQAAMAHLQAAARRAQAARSMKVKSALKKKDRKARKSVTFCDTIAEDITKTEKADSKEKKSEKDAKSDDPSEKQAAGYDSDYDEDTSDSCDSSDEQQSTRCMLCRKRRVDPPHVYCKDCDVYMQRFLPKPELPADDCGYDGKIKTV